MSKAESIVDDFLDEGQVSEANLEFTLTKDQLDKIKAAFKPLQFETYVRFEFFDSGLVTVSSNDKGITSWVNLSTTEMDLQGESYQFFYLDTKRIGKLADVCSGKIAFSVSNGEMSAKIDTTDLHISLPLYESAIDTSFTSENAESKESNDLEILTNRLKASKGSGTFLIPTMSLGQSWKYGTTQNVSIVRGGFQELEVLVTPDFLDYLSNITFTNEDVEFRVGKDADGSEMFCIVSDQVHYKCPISPLQFEDVDQIFAEEPDCSFKMDTLDSIGKLQILSIPLVGQDNASFNLKVTEDKIEVTVRDEGHRESYDTWACTDINGEFEAPIGLQSYLNTVNAMSKDNVTVESRGPALILKDDVQTTILIKYM